MTPVPPRRDLMRVLLLVMSAAACTRLGVTPADARVVDALDVTADVQHDDGPRACPPPPQGHAAGEPDPTLQGSPVDDPRLATFYPKGAAQDALGRIYVYGAAFNCHGTSVPTDAAVVRLMENGELDPSFGEGGLACTGRVAGDPLHNSAFALAFDDRGRVVLAGLYYISFDDYRSGVLVARFDLNGAPDEEFSSGGFRRLAIGLDRDAPTSACFAVLAEADGFVLAGAERDPFGTSTFGFVARIGMDGTLDPNFHDGQVWFDPSAWAFSSLARTSLGYAVGGASLAERRPRVVMLGRDGARVMGFGSGGVANHPQRGLQVRGLEVDPSGGFVLAGEIGDTRSTGLVRFDPNGQSDMAFGTEGLATISVPSLPGFQLGSALARQCDGRLLFVGGDRARSVALAGVTPDGHRDTTFGSNGFVRFMPDTEGSTFVAYAALVDPRDGRITVVTGSNFDRGIALWRFWP